MGTRVPVRARDFLRGALLFGIAVAVCLGSAHDAQRFRDHGVVAASPGVVTESVAAYRNHHVMVRFTDRSGQVEEADLDDWDGDQPPVGAQVPVRYLPEDPTVAMDARLPVTFWVPLWSGLAALALAGWGLFALTRRSSKAPARGYQPRH